MTLRVESFETQIATSDYAAKHRCECNHGPDIDRHNHRGPLGGAITPVATMAANAASGPPLRRGADRVHYSPLYVQVARTMAVAAPALVVGRFSAWPS